MSDDESKAQLVHDMASRDNSVVQRAVGDLRRRGWLTDGTLHGAHLEDANLMGAWLMGADLCGAHLYRADLLCADLSGVNLKDVTDLTDRQLARCIALEGATMQDGSHYDGRFNLPGDIHEAKNTGFGIENPESMARYYEVTLEIFQKGQEWARKNDEWLSRARCPKEIH